MRKLLSLVFLLAFFSLFSQQDTGAIKVNTDPKVDEMLTKHILINGQKKLKGYRIKIHFGPDKARAKDVKAKFLGRFPDIKAYEDYQIPNFTVKVGDFRNRFDAYRTLKVIQAEFPTAFIVEDEIRSPEPSFDSAQDGQR